MKRTTRKITKNARIEDIFRLDERLTRYPFSQAGQTCTKKKKGGINKVDRRANILRYPISQFAAYRILRMQNVGEAIDVDDLATTIAELQFPC